VDRILTLHFIDGTKLTLEFPEQVAIAAARQQKFAEILAAEQLVVEVEGSVLVIPRSSIKYLSLSLPDVSAKDLLPRSALTGARIRN
jgi:hypothetical protein